MQMHSSKNKRISRLFHIRKIVSNLKSIDRSLVKKYTRYLITIVGCVGAYMIGLGLDSKLASFHTDPEKDAIELVLRGTVEQRNVLCDHEREDFPCDDFEARAPASSKSVRPLHITLAHTNASLYVTRVQARACLCARRACTQNRVHAAKNSERSQRSVPGTAYLELENSTNRAYTRARPIRSPFFSPLPPSPPPARLSFVFLFFFFSPPPPFFHQEQKGSFRFVSFRLESGERRSKR